MRGVLFAGLARINNRRKWTPTPDTLLDAGLDSVKMLPFLYLAYLLIEWIERTRGSRIEALLAGGQPLGRGGGRIAGHHSPVRILCHGSEPFYRQRGHHAVEP